MTNALATFVGVATDDWRVTLGVVSVEQRLLGPPDQQWLDQLERDVAAGAGHQQAERVRHESWAETFQPPAAVSVISSNPFQLQLAFTNAAPLKTNGLFFSLQLSSHLNGHHPGVQQPDELGHAHQLCGHQRPARASATGGDQFQPPILPRRDSVTRRFYRAVLGP